MDKILLTAKYVEGDLTDVEFRQFETAVQYDSELQGYLSQYKEVHRAVGIQLKEVFKSKPRNAAQYEAEIKEKLDFTLDYFWFFGWIFVAVLIVLIWKPWKTSLYDEFGLHNEDVVSNLVAVHQPGFDKAAYFVTKHDFYEAKQIVSKSFIEAPEDGKLAYSYAILLMADDCFETAMEVLRPVSRSYSSLRNDATYMLALCNLKLGDTERCKELLQRIPETDNLFEQSARLLTSLRVEEKQQASWL